MFKASDSTPLIIDTDIGGDPDDCVALILAAKIDPRLALVVTTDEMEGRRARFARSLLDKLGRHDVPVVSGATLGPVKYDALSGLLAEEEVQAQPADFCDAIRRCIGAAPSVRWLGIGPMTNLAAFLKESPEMASKLDVVQMGGRVEDPEDAPEHNFRLDPSAAGEVLQKCPNLRLVTADVTFRPEMEVKSDSPFYRLLQYSDAPWAVLARKHFDRWFGLYFPSSCQHDGLALSVLLGAGFVRFEDRLIGVDDEGTLLTGSGKPALLSTGADYQSFLSWIEEVIGAAS